MNVRDQGSSKLCYGRDFVCHEDTEILMIDTVCHIRPAPLDSGLCTYVLCTTYHLRPYVHVVPFVVRRESFRNPRSNSFLNSGRLQTARNTKHELGPETPSSHHMAPPLIALLYHLLSFRYCPTPRPSTASFPTSGRWNGPLAGQSVVSSP
jgi:hypothetical protein